MTTTATQQTEDEQRFAASAQVLRTYGYAIAGGAGDTRSAAEMRLLRLADAVVFARDRRERSKRGEQVTTFPGLDLIAPPHDSYWRDRVDAAVTALRANLAELPQAHAARRIEQLEQALRLVADQAAAGASGDPQAALGTIRFIVNGVLGPLDTDSDTISDGRARELATLWADERYPALTEFARTGRITVDTRCELDEMDLDGCSPEERAEWRWLRDYMQRHDVRDAVSNWAEQRPE